MFEKLANIFRIPDLRKRVLFTLAMLAVYRIGGHLPTPGINTRVLENLFNSQRGTMLGFIDLFSGGFLRRMTIFALGIMPYITASIILQLLTVVYEPLARLQKEGELGRKKITQWTRYLTVILSALQSAAIAITLERQAGVVLHPGIGFKLMTILTLTTGSAFIMWLGEQITERGVGNGMSLIIYAGIVVNFPGAVLGTLGQMSSGQLGLISIAILIVAMVVIVGAIIFIERGHRRVTVQYAKRVVGRRMYGGSSTHIPLKVNTGGVIPVIFASSIIAFPMTIAGMFQVGQGGF